MAEISRNLRFLCMVGIILFLAAGFPVFAQFSIIIVTAPPDPTPSPTPTATFENTPTPVNIDLANIALGKPVAVSSVASADAKGSNAVDGNPATRWSSEIDDPQWITVDLGSQWTVTRIVLTWDKVYAKHYTVQVSEDSTIWTVSEAVWDNSSGTNVIHLSEKGRFVRIYCIDSGTNRGYSIRELEIYGH